MRSYIQVDLDMTSDCEVLLHDEGDQMNLGMMKLDPVKTHTTHLVEVRHYVVGQPNIDVTNILNNLGEKENHQDKKRVFITSLAITKNEGKIASKLKLRFSKTTGTSVWTVFELKLISPMVASLSLILQKQKKPHKNLLIISIPGRSQGLLYKNLRDSLTDELIERSFS